MSGKLLMFAKLSLKSFTYSLAELLTFPEENKVVQEIFDKYLIEKNLIYQILTDTDSTSLQFVAISKLETTFTENDLRNILFEISSKIEIKDRFDKSDDFWQFFGVHMPDNQKVPGI